MLCCLKSDTKTKNHVNRPDRVFQIHESKNDVKTAIEYVKLRLPTMSVFCLETLSNNLQQKLFY